MIEYIYNDIYHFTEELYKKYNINNQVILKQILVLEDDIYDKLNYDYLIKLYDYALSNFKQDNQNDDDDYEVPLYANESSFVIRRIFFKLSKKLLEYVIYENANNNIQKYIEFLNEKILYISSDIKNALYELQEKIFVNIEIKFLYFLTIDNNINIDKQEYINNMSFINPYLEEKIIDGINFNNLLKEEDNLYNNLWDYVKDDYEEFLYTTVINSINNDIVIMHSNRDLNNDDNTKIREIYLRTLFNYLDEDILEQVNYKFRSEDLYPFNKKGYEAVINAFKSFDKDKTEIEKIKTL